MTAGTYSQNPFVRRGRRTLLTLSLPLRSATGIAVLCNSIPKAGTHLLSKGTALLAAYDAERHFSEMSGSFSYRRRNAEDAVSFIRSLRTGEHARAHMEFSPARSTAITERGAAAFLIVRDPVDLARSEANYLRVGNRYHRLHRKHFAALSPQQALADVVLGVDGLLEPLADRIGRFAGWLDCESSFAIHYEDLQHGASRGTVASRVVGWLAARDLESPVTAGQLEAAWASRDSHTLTAARPVLPLPSAILESLQPSRRLLGYE